MKATSALGPALLLALAVTSCSSASSTNSTLKKAPTSAPTTVATVAAAPQTATTASTSAGPPRCLSSGLRASLGQSQGAAGHSYVALLLTNQGRVACTLDGYPGVSFTAGADAHQVGSPAQPDQRAHAAPVTLAPGATAHMTVAIANHANYDKQTCQPVQAAGYRIYPPRSTGSLLVPAPQMVCAKPGVQGFRTSVVLTGSVSD